MNSLLRYAWVGVVSIVAALSAAPAAATQGWFSSVGDGSVLYRSPQEACFLGVMGAYIEADRPSRPPAAQYRILGSNVSAVGDGDYHCQGVLHVRSGPGATNWTLLLTVGDAMVMGNPNDACSLPGYSDPVTGQCGPPKCTDECCGACPNGSNPIHGASGNKHQREVDFVGSGPFPLRLERSYDSNRVWEKRSRPLGIGWMHSYGAFIVGIGPSPFAAAVAYRPDGRVLSFTRTGSTWQGDPDVPERLSLETDASGMPQWKLVTADDHTEVYDGIGLLRSITNRDGLTQTLDYVDAGGRNSGRVYTVTDPQGRRLRFAYDASGRIDTVTDENDVVIQYGRDASNNLTSVTWPMPGGASATRTYHYAEAGQTGGVAQPHALTGITDELNQRFASWGYDNRGRATLSVHGPFAGGSIDRTALVFNADGTTGVTDALGQQRTFGFDVKFQVARTAALDVPCDYCAGAAQTKAYDANGYPQSERDFRDTETLHTFDARGLESVRIEANSIPDPANPAQRITPPEQRTIHTSWHTSLRVPLQRTVTNRAGVIESRTDWSYNTRGQPLARCDYDLTVAGAAGYVCAATGTPPAGIRRWVTSYCDAVDGSECPLVGLVRSVDGPRTDVADVTTWTWRMADDPATPKKYRKGDLWKVTNALGHVTQYLEYDGNGRPTKIVDRNGVVTTMIYHPRGWLRERTVRARADGAPDANDATTTIAYDGVGNVVQVTQPDGAYLHYDYDVAHRLIRITDNTGARVEFTLDALGNRTAEKTYASGGSTPVRLLTRSYDTLSRLSHEFDAQGRDTQFSYDVNGNRTDQIDPLLVKTRWAYDRLNRLESLVQDDQGSAPATANTTTAYAYDARDNLRQVTDPDALTTAYMYDGLGNLDGLNSPDTQTTTYSQDAAGNRTSQIDARGVENGYGHDALGRLTGIKFGSSPSASYLYDEGNLTTGCAISYPVGRLTRMLDASGSTTWCYDHRGNVISKTQVTHGSTYVLGYEYNVADRLMAIAYPDGVRVEYTRDALGRVSALKLRLTPGGALTTVVSSITYLPFGPAQSYAFASGGQSLALTYDQNYWLNDVGGSVLNLHLCRDGLANITRLAASAPACTASAIEQYGYDALSRLTLVQNGSGGTVERYSYGKTGDRLSKTVGSTTTNYSYTLATSHRLLGVGSDARDYDNAGNQTSGSSPSRTWTFDDRNRMATYSQSGIGFGRSGSYDYNGRGERVFKDGRGPLAQHNSAHFVYDEAGLLLTDNGNGNPNPTDYVHVDGRPLALVRNGSIYYVHSDQLGTPRAVTAAGSATPLWSWSFAGNPFGEQAPTGSFTNMLRFPGQYYDPESGLHSNYFRDYEPGTGRYVESDPIGLDGGSTTFGYALGSPAFYFDTLGLDAQCENCDDRVTSKRVQRWCDQFGKRIRDKSLASCVRNKCQTAQVKCKSRCLVKCDGDAAPRSGGFAGLSRRGDNHIVLCMDTDPSRDQAGGGWGAVIIHEFSHLCGWMHCDGGGVPRDHTPSECKRAKGGDPQGGVCRYDPE